MLLLLFKLIRLPFILIVETIRFLLIPPSSKSSPSNFQDLRISRSDKFLSDNFGPVSKEVDQENCQVIGSIPEDIQGIYVRNGPNPKLDMTSYHYHWFDGDGMLHGVRINNKKASYKNRWIKTDLLLQEQQTGKVALGGIGYLQNTIGFVVRIARTIWKGISKDKKSSTRANTNLEYHDGRLLALYEASEPTHVHVPDLETIGSVKWNGQLKHPFTAHPKVDPVSGDMFFFGYILQKKPFLSFSVIGKDGQWKSSFEIQTKTPSMMHDFAITENYAIFPVLPFTLDIKRLLDNNPIMYFDEKQSSKFGILSKYAKDESGIKWFESPSCYFFHVANAWEEEDDVHLIACRSNKILVELGNVIKEKKGEKQDPNCLPNLHQWTFNLKTGKVTEKSIHSDLICEFPVIHPKYTGRKNRFIFTARIVEHTYVDALAKIDLVEGTKKIVQFGPNKTGGEFSLIPKGKKAQDGEEDNCYLIGFVYDSSTDKSSCYIYDAKSFSSQPLCQIELPQRVPYGFHGRWLTEEEIQNQRAV